MDMNKAQDLATFIEEEMSEAADLYHEYSGRGMRGRTTVGIKTTAHPGDVQQAIDDAIYDAEGYDDDRAYELECLRDFSYDNLGLGWVLY